MIWMPEIPAFVPFFVGALLVLLTGGLARTLVLIATPILGAVQLWTLPVDVTWQIGFLDYELMPFRTDRLSLLFGYVFHLAALIAIIFSLHLRDTLQHATGMLYAGSALGAVFAGDLLTLFVFWELLAFTSVFLIWARHSARSYISGMRYLVIHVLSGVLLMTGVIFHAESSGSLEFNRLGLDSTASWLIFIAFGIKCGFPLVHNWITDSYAEATPTGTVFLSAFTTKVAVYALARGFPGVELLVYLGAVMTCFPIFFAVIENDLRRVLAYSLINQVGFMVVGVGIGTALAINGAVAHAFTDIIFKALLFMSMGAVLYMTGRINGSDLGGLYKSMPKTTTLCIIGAASISAFPLFSGFISKSMVMSAALKSGYDWIWLMLLFASAGVFHHAGIKIPYFAFFAHDSGIRTGEPPVNMLAAMSIAAVLCIAIGVYPSALYQLLPFDVDYSPYDTTHVLAQLQLLFFSALAFVWLKLYRLYPPELRSVVLDVEWIYRKLIPDFFHWLRRLITRYSQRLKSAVSIQEDHMPGYRFRNNAILVVLDHPGRIGVMALWVAVLLMLMLILGFISA